MSLWVVFEGPDAAGKTTLTQETAKLLNEYPGHKFKVETTKEPGTPHYKMCVSLRDMVLSENLFKDIQNQSLSDLIRTELFMIDHQINRYWVQKKLDYGKIVLSDRTIISDMCYRPQVESAFRKVFWDNFLATQNKLVFILLCQNPKTYLERIKDRGGLTEFEEIHVVNRLEAIDFQYRRLAYTLGMNVLPVFTDISDVESTAKYITSAIISRIERGN